MPNDVNVPVEYAFYALDGHARPDQDVERRFLCKATCQRHLLHPDVKRMEIEEGRIRGTLFIPKGKDVF